MKKLFIQFTGAQSTGKTTLINSLLESEILRFYKIHPIQEVSRTLLSKKQINFLDVNAEDFDQLKISANLLLEYYSSNFIQKDIIISERSPICNLAYTRHLKNPSNYIIEFAEKVVLSLDKRIKTFYFPPSIAYQDDNVRNKDSRNIIDEEIQNIIKEYNIPVINVPNELNERIKLLTDTIINEIKEIN